MAKSFAELKKSSETSLSNLQSKLEATSKKTSFAKDDRYWVPKKDDAGNATAIIRFLPEPDGEELPYVSYFDHSFVVNGRYYIEKSLSSIGKQDAVGIANKELWDSGDEANRKIASSRKRRTHYISNILVIKDSGNPENNGKVFLFSYGLKIFNKIKDKIQPAIDKDTNEFLVDPVYIFDFFKGANFLLKVKKQGDFPNYDESQFLDSSPLFKGDEVKMEEIWNKQYSLEAEIAPDKFKTPEELEKKFNWVIYGKDNEKTAEEKVTSSINKSSKTEDEFDIDVMSSNNSSSNKKKEEEEKNDDNDFELKLDDFNLDDDTPF